MTAKCNSCNWTGNTSNLGNAAWGMNQLCPKCGSDNVEGAAVTVGVRVAGWLRDEAEVSK